MTDATNSTPTPTPTPTPAAKKATPTADDSKAKREGFANAESKAAAAKAATSKPRKARKTVDRKPAEIIANLRKAAPEAVEAAVEKGVEVAVALGNDRGPVKVVEPEAVTLVANPSRRGGRWLVDRAVVHNTHTLPRTIQFTHVWLMAAGGKPLDVAEMGSPVGLSPGQQLEFKRGQLAFG